MIPGETNYRLKSDLARLCLPDAARDSDRAFAWMNSICFLFLVIGIFGRPEGIRIRPLPPPEEIIPAVVEPVVLPPPTSAIRVLKPEDSPQEKPDAAQVVIVTPDLPEIKFSVPTIGNLVVPSAMAVAPPLRPMVAPAPRPVARAEKPQPSELNNTGSGGARPQPPYPPAALEHHQQGTVVLSLTVDETGNVATIDVKESSGSQILDRGTLDFVRRRWKVPPGAGTRMFEATITYRLEVD